MCVCNIIMCIINNVWNIIIIGNVCVMCVCIIIIIINININNIIINIIIIINSNNENNVLLIWKY